MILKIAAGVFLGGMGVFITSTLYHEFRLQRIIDAPQRLLKQQAKDERDTKYEAAQLRERSVNTTLERACIKRVNMTLNTTITDYTVIESRGSFVELTFVGHDTYKHVECKAVGSTSLVADFEIR